MKVVANALRVLEVVALHQPVSLKDVAQRTGLPLSTAHRALGALAGSGWVQAVPDKRWAVAGRVHAVFAAQPTSLLSAASAVCARLRDVSGESVTLSVPDDDSVVIVRHWDGPGVLRVVHVEGTRAPLPVAATGKAYLAQLDAERRDALLRCLAPGKGRTSMRWIRGLDHELAMVRSQGWAVVDGEWIEGVVQVGAAVVVGGTPVAGIGVGLPSQRVGPDVVRRLGPLARDAAAEVAALLGDGVASQEVSR